MDYLNDTSTHHAAARPMSVKEIAEKAIEFDYNPLIPLRYWHQTANTLLKEATIYQAEGNEQQAYLLLLRQAESANPHLPYTPNFAKLTRIKTTYPLPPHPPRRRETRIRSVSPARQV